MSAFIMESEATAMLAEQLVRLVEWDRISCRRENVYIAASDKTVIIEACRKWNRAQEVPRINPINVQVLFYVMENMNAQALLERYGNEISENITPYPGNVKNPVNMTAFYKTLQCYLYQCCEGDVPECELYKALENVKITLAQYIVSDLPEYEAAAWG